MEEKEDEMLKCNEYINKIVVILNKINDAGTLEYLHTFIELFVEKWG